MSELKINDQIIIDTRITKKTICIVAEYLANIIDKQIKAAENMEDIDIIRYIKLKEAAAMKSISDSFETSTQSYIENVLGREAGTYPRFE